MMTTKKFTNPYLAILDILDIFKMTTHPPKVFTCAGTWTSSHNYTINKEEVVGVGAKMFTAWWPSRACACARVGELAA